LWIPVVLGLLSSIGHGKYLKPLFRIVTAVTFMRISKQEVGRLPVTENGKLVGIVTHSDVFRAIENKTEVKR
jgi:CBS domain-containing protein